LKVHRKKQHLRDSKERELSLIERSQSPLDLSPIFVNQEEAVCNVLVTDFHELLKRENGNPPIARRFTSRFLRIKMELEITAFRH
jgi:hypothetical protein